MAARKRTRKTRRNPPKATKKISITPAQARTIKAVAQKITRARKSR